MEKISIAIKAGIIYKPINQNDSLVNENNFKIKCTKLSKILGIINIKKYCINFIFKIFVKNCICILSN